MTLSLISLLARPVNTFIRAIPTINTALVSLGRIQEFLQSESRHNHCIILENSPALTQPIQSSSEGLELSDLSPPRHNSVSEVIAAWDINFA